MAEAVYRVWAAIVVAAVLLQIAFAGYGAFYVASKVDDNPVNQDTFDDGWGLHLGSAVQGAHQVGHVEGDGGVVSRRDGTAAEVVRAEVHDVVRAGQPALPPHAAEGENTGEQEQDADRGGGLEEGGPHAVPRSSESRSLR